MALSLRQPRPRPNIKHHGPDPRHGYAPVIFVDTAGQQYQLPIASHILDDNLPNLLRKHGGYVIDLNQRFMGNIFSRLAYTTATETIVDAIIQISGLTLSKLLDNALKQVLLSSPWMQSSNMKFFVETFGAICEILSFELGYGCGDRLFEELWFFLVANADGIIGYGSCDVVYHILRPAINVDPNQVALQRGKWFVKRMDQNAQVQFLNYAVAEAQMKRDNWSMRILYALQ